MENVLNEKMVINEKFVSIKDLVKGYVNNDGTDEGGVFTMNGTLCVRPHYQRSYIRKESKQWKENLIHSILKGYPISLFYFGDNEDGTYDMIDGQQRTITICDFVNHGFSIVLNKNEYYYNNLPEIYRKRLDDYLIRVNVCVGDSVVKLRWFEIINEPNSPLEKQELRNATYGGEWLEKNKKYFSAPTSMTRGKEVLDKDSKYAAFRYTERPKIERQEILQLALDWASASELPEIKDKDKRIEKYMAIHQKDTDNMLIDFYKKVIDWIWSTFLDLEENLHSSRKTDGTPHSMANVDWGKLYFNYSNKTFDTKYVSKRLCELLDDDDIVKKHGIYEYILSGEKDESLIQIRSFSAEKKAQMYSYQGGIDPIDGKRYSLKDMETHHIIAWAYGGKTVIGNCVLLAKHNHIDFHNHCLETNDIIARRDALWKKNNPKEYAKYIAYKEIEEKFSNK